MKKYKKLLIITTLSVSALFPTLISAQCSSNITKKTKINEEFFENVKITVDDFNRSAQYFKQNIDSIIPDSDFPSDDYQFLVKEVSSNDEEELIVSFVFVNIQSKKETKIFTQKIQGLNTIFDEAKYILELKIEKAKSMKGTYTDINEEEGSFNKANEFIQQAIDSLERVTNTYNKNKTNLSFTQKQDFSNQLNNIGQILDNKMLECETIANQTDDAKRKIKQQKFEKQIFIAEDTLKKLTKISAIKHLENELNNAKLITKNNSRYYAVITEETKTLIKVIEEAQAIEKKTDKELLETFLKTEHVYLNKIQRMIGNIDESVKYQKDVTTIFSEVKEKLSEESKNFDYAKQEKTIRDNIEKILNEIKDTILITDTIKQNYEDDITNLNVSGKYKYIYSDSFQNFKKLSSVILEKGIEKIFQGSFNNSPITKLVIPDSVKYLAGFHNIKLTELILPDSIEVINFGFNNVETLNQVSFNENLKIVKGFNNSNISELILPSTVEVVEGFKNTPIKKMKIGSNLIKMNINANELNEITIDSNFKVKNVLNEQTIYNVTNDITSTDKVVISLQNFPKLKHIYVPDEAMKLDLIKCLKNKNDEILNTSQYTEYLKHFKKLFELKKQKQSLSSTELDDEINLIEKTLHKIDKEIKTMYSDNIDSLLKDQKFKYLGDDYISIAKCVLENNNDKNESEKGKDYKFISLIESEMTHTSSLIEYLSLIQLIKDEITNNSFQISSENIKKLNIDIKDYYEEDLAYFNKILNESNLWNQIIIVKK
ncbi:leucine-rich repeat protein [Mycoplasma phocoenae]|uniref:Leucine-rich repeat protein n=1 Tax=Mycoplasma phocoenae TaxID=754517 RepID=A0A858U8G6_9MOLU|nr:leucine-rich repeat protein [Mycoplasma phocoenae]QJG67038.1 leucine-rich repeat protein [Mycoplasma phocoenae]